MLDEKEENKSKDPNDIYLGKVTTGKYVNLEIYANFKKEKHWEAQIRDEIFERVNRYTEMNRYDETIVEDLYPLRKTLAKFLALDHPEHSEFRCYGMALYSKIKDKIKEFEEGEDE